jgi:hypothetical protein
VGVKARPVAPAIFVPSTYHCRVMLVPGPGDQVPRDTVSSTPTCGVPVIVGAAVFCTVLSTKWMKPVGHRPLSRVIVRQWKSPLQESSLMTISSAETTRST